MRENQCAKQHFRDDHWSWIQWWKFYQKQTENKKSIFNNAYGLTLKELVDPKGSSDDMKSTCEKFIS